MSWGEVAQHRLTEIAHCSAAGPGVTRFPFTPEHRAALEHIEAWMGQAGLSAHLDAAGTLVGCHAGAGKRVLLGSHQDTVRHAGRYDGIMGVVLACLAMEKLRAEDRAPSFPVEVLAFADEEGVRFPTALLGPRALAGTVDPAVFDMTDSAGISLGHALDGFGGTPSAIADLARSPADIRAYLELHIEQGPVLERQDTAVGIVTGICGIERNEVVFEGETGHAGTVPMQGRADALVAAADFIRRIHDAACDTAELRATVGTCSLSPHVVNAIPAQAKLSLEIRALSDATRQAFADRAHEIARDCAERRGCRMGLRKTYEQVAVRCAPGLVSGFEAVVREAGVTPLQLPSGATHDASPMSELCEIGMLFVRCRGGLSHRPEEYASAEDMGTAIDVLAGMLMRLDQEAHVSMTP